MISVSRQCDLLGISRAGYYYKPTEENSQNLLLMRLIDELYTSSPFYGVAKMTAWLKRQGYFVNPKRISRLMRLMGIEAIYPKRNLSISAAEHKKYPYLLRDIEINRPDQVFCADITYIRMNRGFLYLVAIMDWFSRYIVAWEISITLEAAFCVQALTRALMSADPNIFNIDQGAQFTSSDFLSPLKLRNIKISMDGRGRAYDNILIERFWRTLKYEEVYLHDYRSVSEARWRINAYMQFYNTQRLHESLGYRTPYEVYFKQTFNIETGQADSKMHLQRTRFLS
jgi:putative transposase